MEHCASDDLKGSWDFFSRKHSLEEGGDETRELWILISTLCCLLCAAYFVWVWLNDGKNFFTSEDSEQVKIERGLRNLASFHKCVLWVVEAMNRERPPQINPSQCKFLIKICELLSMKCELLSMECQRLGSLCKPIFARQDFVLQEFYWPVRKAYKLVEDCYAENWLLKAVGLGNCREHFLEILRDIHRSIIVLKNPAPDVHAQYSDIMMSETIIDEATLDGLRELDSIDLINMVQRQYGDGHYLADQLREEPVFLRAPPEISKHVTEFDICSTPLIFPADPGCEDTCGPVVFRVMHSNLPFVIKIYWRKATDEEPQASDQGSDPFQREADIMRKCRHPYAVGLVGYWEVTSRSPKIPLLLMESMECNLRELITKRNEPPTLRNMWRGTRGFPAQDAINLMLPVAKALRHMHKTRFVHRDIKPPNILYTHVSPTQHFPEDISVKLADFGSAQEVVEGVTSIDTKVGTPGYKDPYLSQGVCYEADRLYKADVFSFGLVFGEVLTGLSPAEALDCMCRYGEVWCVSRAKLHEKLFAGNRPPLPKDTPHFVKSLVERCCSAISADRPSFVDICDELQLLRYC